MRRAGRLTPWAALALAVVAVRLLRAPRLRVLVVRVGHVVRRACPADGARLALAMRAVLWHGAPRLAALEGNVARLLARARLAERAAAALAVPGSGARAKNEWAGKIDGSHVRAFAWRVTQAKCPRVRTRMPYSQCSGNLHHSSHLATELSLSSCRSQRARPRPRSMLLRMNGGSEAEALARRPNRSAITAYTLRAERRILCV